MVCKSLPSRGAWIEILNVVSGILVNRMVAPLAGSVDRNPYLTYDLVTSAWSLPSRGAWIEILPYRMVKPRSVPSLPSRGAWIEICGQQRHHMDGRVAPLAGSVDRNTETDTQHPRGTVAPLAGSVDRNLSE